MYCTECGNKLNDGTRFCGNCGAAASPNGACGTPPKNEETVPASEEQAASDRPLTRRTALKIAGAVAGGAVMLTPLAWCATRSAEDKINEGNDEVIKGLDLAKDVLPMGSVVELEGGRFMVTCNTALTPNHDGTFKVFDYYGAAWPTGLQSVFNEVYSSAAFNASDIKRVLFVGYADEESKDFRDYVSSYDRVAYDPSTYSKGTEPKYYDAGTRVEKDLKYRLQGKRSEELYGADGKFKGGLICSDTGSEG